MTTQHNPTPPAATPATAPATPVTDEVLNFAISAVLPLLQQEVAGAPAVDIIALDALPAMWDSGQISLAGYATALWLRLKEHADLRTYYSAVGVPNIWFDERRYELSQWNARALQWWTQRTAVIEEVEQCELTPAAAASAESEAQP